MQQLQQQQWGRSWSLYLTDSAGSGMDLSALRCTFRVTKKDVQTPNAAELTVYNAMPSTVSAIRRSFKRVVVNAGYQSNTGLIFTGNIKGFETGRDGTDTWLRVTAGDGDEEYNYSVINKSIAAGATAATVISEASSAMGIKVKANQIKTGKALPRGKVMYGRPQELLKEQALGNKCTWSVQDGEIIILERTGVLPGSAIVFTPETGLIDQPSGTEDGAAAMTLLQPKLRIGGLFKLETTRAPDLNGTYRCIALEHRGDTHGTEWYTEFKGLTMNQTAGKVDKK